jgi:hypothetical protein
MNYPPYSNDPNDPHSQPTTAGQYPQWSQPGQPSYPQWGQQTPPPPPQFPSSPGQWSQNGQNFPPYPQPGQFGPPPAQPKPPKPPWWDTKARNEYYKQHPLSKKDYVIGCGTIIGVLLLCGVCGAIANAGNATTKQSVSANASIQQPTHVEPTDTPTPEPTATPTDTPTPTPTPTPIPTLEPVQQQQPVQQSVQQQPAPATGVNGNPWGYDFNPGNYITAPPSAFCSYFNCIASFWNGKGHVEECNDATYSKSGGISGSCSKHGGDWRPLYSH